MAEKNKTTQTPAPEPRKKADVILEKVECLLSCSNELVSRMDKTVAGTSYISRQNSEIFEKTLEENANLRQQIKYIAAQNQNVFDKLSAIITELSGKVSELQQALETQTAAVNQTIGEVNQSIGDVNQTLTEKIGGVMQAVESLAGKEEKSEIAVTIDYDAIAEAVAARIDIEELAKEVSERITIPAPETNNEEQSFHYEAEELSDVTEGEDEPYGIDYDLIADKVAERLVRSVTGSEDEEASGSIKEEISADYIASRVAEQILIPDPDYDAIADAVFDRFYQDDENNENEEDEDDGFDEEVEEDYIPTADELEQFAADENALPEYEPIDYEKIATLVVEKLVEADEEYTEPDIEPYDIEKFTNLVFDYEKLADLVAERLFRDEGQGEEIEEDETFELDYDKLAEAIAAKITIAEVPAETKGEDGGEAEAMAEGHEDYQEAESVQLSEDTVARIVDEISKRVCEYLPAEYDIVVDDEGCAAIAEAISEKLPAMETETVTETVTEEADYDIVIDEQGVAGISEGVAAKVIEATAERIGETENKLAAFEQAAGGRFDKIEADVGEIKGLLQSGAIAAASEELAAASAAETVEEFDAEAAEDVEAEPVEEPAEQAENVENGENAEEDGEQLVTVSDVIGGEAENAENAEEDETLGGVVEFIEQPETDMVIEEIIGDINEQPVDGEIMPDGLDSDSGAVDFANMMKYNRSFIARIIQGSDEVKTYYGQTKTALLSYKKVNSSVAWGAERFNKGRETIAKFKIRGKTLCLYLALDPNEYKTSVYHHVDVSDNKSMATTPMMVKIKSPLGVKKAIRLIDDMLAKRGGVKQNVVERDYVAMYPYETIEELIEDGLVKDVSKNK